MVRELAPCGTYAAYKRHRWHGERPCRPCLDACNAARRRYAENYAKHGYIAYTAGCRCDVCRAAKVEYQRRKRSAARDRRARVESGGGSYVAASTEHGRSGYDNHLCRCDTCRAAKSISDRRRRAS